MTIQLYNEELATSYLIQKNIFNSPKVKLIEIGNINYVYQIKANDKVFYLKHFGETIRKTTKAIEKIGYTKERMDKEIGGIQFLNSILDEEFKGIIPKIIFQDKINRVVILSNVDEKKQILKEILLSDFDLEKTKDIMKQIAKFIAQQHIKTFQKQHFEPFFKEDKEFNKRFYDFRTKVSCEKLSTEQQNKVQIISEEIIKNNEKFSCLINNDLSPKQIFIRPNNKIGLCDFEIMGKGVAPYDIGFFISNILIIKTIRQDYQSEINSIIKEFLNMYFQETKSKLSKEFIEFTTENINFFIGTGILNRIDAVPLEKHIPESKANLLRKLGVGFIFKHTNIELELELHNTYK